MTTPRWVGHLVEQHNALLEKKLLVGLAREEVLTQARINAKLDAWLAVEDLRQMQRLRDVLRALEAKEAAHGPHD